MDRLFGWLRVIDSRVFFTPIYNEDNHRVKLKRFLLKIKYNVLTLWYAIHHQNTPKFAKVLAFLVCAYAFSPIDLIPDFIPVLGYLDDIIIIPLGIYFTFKLIPEPIILYSRLKAEEHIEKKLNKPKVNTGIVIILMLWLLIAVALYYITKLIIGS